MSINMAWKCAPFNPESSCVAILTQGFKLCHCVFAPRPPSTSLWETQQKLFNVEGVIRGTFRLQMFPHSPPFRKHNYTNVYAYTHAHIHVDIKSICHIHMQYCRHVRLHVLVPYVISVSTCTQYSTIHSPSCHPWHSMPRLGGWDDRHMILL